MQETPVQFLGQEDLLEKGQATLPSILGLPCGSAGKESACNVGNLGWEDPLENRKAFHFSILSQRIPWTIQSMGSQRKFLLRGLYFQGQTWLKTTQTSKLSDLTQGHFPYMSVLCFSGIKDLYDLYEKDSRSLMNQTRDKNYLPQNTNFN